MFSPALRHRQKKLAEQVIRRAGAEGFAPERPATGQEATEYELLLAALGEDLRRLKDIQSTERKIEAKREMIGRYIPHISATLAAANETGTALQDEVLVTMMLWCIDIGEYMDGLDLAEHVLRHGLRLPELFKRGPAPLIAEEIADAALKANSQGSAFDLAVLQRVEQLTIDADMHDVIRAKLNKAMGHHLLHYADAQEASEDGAAGAPRAAREAALEHYRRAFALDPAIGVKKDIERLTAALAKAAPPEQAATE